MKKGNFRLTCVAQKRRCLSSLITDWGGGGLGGGVGTGIGAAFEHFFCPARIFYHIWTLFSLQAQGSEIWPKKMGKICIYIYIYIKIMQLLVHTLIPALCSTLYLPPFLRCHPLQLIKTIPPHPTQKSTKCPGNFEKSEVKKLCLTRSQLILIPSTWRKTSQNKGQK